ncbi:tagaturonate reductase [Paenibacillus polygoni]|uniref:Tagaturonate reductase n=1 Tax=Paenibacillus polygoni TaxID=3050112 RepID=A0ABY8X6R0_9BACL|nr:tagaturonate reductase [Paenibacillus polygoni]WIV20718.1 tagaturonate reductase [Paenibacillus polygoni]
MTVKKDYPRLSLQNNNSHLHSGKAEIKQLPVKVLQIGEGNFLRGFADWMIYESAVKGAFKGTVAVTQPRRKGRGKLLTIREQDGLYTLLTRGIVNGTAVEKTSIIPILSRTIDPYEEWQDFLQLAVSPDLDIIISNTTEAGLTYLETRYEEGVPIDSFPGKLTVFLHERYTHYSGSKESGLLILPCELVDRNGDVLKKYVLQHSIDFGFSDSFRDWVQKDNRFLNNLVDRIVTGAPSEEEAAVLTERFGYEDKLMTLAEPYHLWAIEGEPDLDDRLPLAQAGLNIHWTSDLKPFQLRKVLLLNGSHTLMTPIAILKGQTYVRETMEDSELGVFVREAAEKEIIPALDLPEEEMQSYVKEVWDRFLNPYINHKLTDIMLGSISKFKVRLLPTLLESINKNGVLPERIVTSFSALLRLYRAEHTDKGYVSSTFSGQIVILRDEEQLLASLAQYWSQYSGANMNEVVSYILADEQIWGQNLDLISGLRDQVAEHLNKWEEEEHNEYV